MRRIEDSATGIGPKQGREGRLPGVPDPDGNWGTNSASHAAYQDPREVTFVDEAGFADEAPFWATF